MRDDKIITKLQIGAKAAHESRQAAKRSELTNQKPEDAIEKLIIFGELDRKKRKLRFEIIMYIIMIPIFWLVWSRLEIGLLVTTIAISGFCIGLIIRLIRYRRLL